MCEWGIESSGAVCMFEAAWYVQREFRKSDRQLSCRRHLSHTVTALMGEDWGRVRILVTGIVPAAMSGQDGAHSGPR
jgi:hypothetical protein